MDFPRLFVTFPERQGARFRIDGGDRDRDRVSPQPRWFAPSARREMSAAAGARPMLASLGARLGSERVAVVLGVVEFALLVLTLAISSIAGEGSLTGVMTIVIVIVLLAVGLIVAYKRPSNRIGWIMLGAAFFLLLSGVGGSYAVLDYRVHHGRLLLGPLAVFIQPSWAPAIVLFALGVILFPEGHLPSPRWRWPMRWLLGLAAAWQLGAYAIAVSAIASGTIHIVSSGDLAQIDNPTSAWAWWGVVQDLFFPTMFAILVAWIASQALGYKRLTGERRIQQKWLLGGAAIAVASMLMTFIPDIFAPSSDVAQTIGNIALVGLCALPLAIGIGILKFRLYDIDRVISRTLSYAILTALLASTFIGLVVLTTQVLPFSSAVGVAASTLAAFALFNPLRRRVQRIVDRRFNRARYDAERTVAAFAARLRDAVDLDAVRAELLDAVKSAVEPTHAAVWIRPRGDRVQGGASR